MQSNVRRRWKVSPTTRLGRKEQSLSDFNLLFDQMNLVKQTGGDIFVLVNVEWARALLQSCSDEKKQISRWRRLLLKPNLPIIA